jgi:hypothetical protein
MKGMKVAAGVILALACLLVPLLATGPGSASSASLNVSPNAGPVGAVVMVSGTGFSPGTSITLAWSTGNATWVIEGNPIEVTGVRVAPFLMNLATVQSDASGSFSAQVTVPRDYGGKKVILSYSANGTALDGKAVFTLEPSFHVSATGGQAGAPITVNASGLGYGQYSTNYHLLWDNREVGYMTGVTTNGEANFMFYASGAQGVHYIDIYEGYPGPAYLNPAQIPAGASSQAWFPPLIPFHAQFTITSGQPPQAASLAVPLGIASLALVVAAPLVSRVPALASGPDRRRGAARRLGALLVSVALVMAGVALFLSFAFASSPQAGFTPQASEVRPQVLLPQTVPAGGPSITVSPEVAPVGANVTVAGSGFDPKAEVALSWSTRQGSNILGYQLVYLPLRNVTADAGGSFSFTMEVPVDLGGVHYISAGDQAAGVNSTLYIERTASISATQGPAGSTITIQLYGVGWDYNTNILAIDYDNSFIGYACGFSSQGNVTVPITVMGDPGVHTIDLYPSLWLGPQNILTIYRYPLLTPQDHPELTPSFHFTYMITKSTTQAQVASDGLNWGALPGFLTIAMGGLFLFLRFTWRGRIP